jgi:hypothetical protein
MLTTILFSDSSSLSSFAFALLNDATKTPPLRLLVPLARLDDTRDEDDEESTKEEENEGEDIEEQPRAKLIIALAVILNDDDKREREREREREKSPGAEVKSAGCFGEICDVM